jgi:sec-independent protein translocase protein TatC
MSLFEHLAELRKRMTRAVIALSIGTVVGYFVFPDLLELIMSPYCAVADRIRPDGTCTLVALTPLEPFSVRLKTSFVVGLFIGGPVIFYQLWRFITPGLTTSERRYAMPFVALSQVMFAVGIGFAYLVIPYGLRTLLGFGGPGIEPLLSASEYLSFFLTLSIAFGLVFELPLILIFLAKVGIVSSAALRKARPYAILAIVVASAFITPTNDAVTLFFMAGPMMLFYELSILSAWLIERSRRKSAL